MNALLQISPSAVHRAAGLVTALRNDDAATWVAVLGNEQDGGEWGSPYETFCGMASLVTVLVNSVSDLAEKDAADVLAEHANAVANLTFDDES